MFQMIKNITKINGFKAHRAFENANAIDLIDLKIRESEQNLSSAKTTLASLIMRQRAEDKNHTRILSQIKDLESRAHEAMAAKRTALVQDAAEAIADLENEATQRAQTLDNLSNHISKIQLSIEKAHRRLITLRQGATTAKAIVLDRSAQKKIDRTLHTTSTFKEAEDLIARVTAQSDPFEEVGILDEIDAGLSKNNITDRLAKEGFGSSTKSRAEDVLNRLKAKFVTKPATK